MFGASIYLIAAVVGGLLVGGIALQTKRVEWAQQEAVLHETATKLALARVETLSVEKRAAEAALQERDTAHEEIKRLRYATTKKLQEVEDAKPEVAAALDCTVPDDVRRLLNDRRGGGGAPAPAAPGNAPAPVPAPARGPGHA